MNIHVLPNQTTKALEHEFGDSGYDDDTDVYIYTDKITSEDLYLKNIQLYLFL